MSGRRSICCALLAVLVGGCGGSDTPMRTAARLPPAPGPIITGAHPSTAARDPLSATQRRRATAAARRFLAGYLRYLYGRARTGRVAPVTPSVARTLRATTARVTPAQRRRHPRVIALKVTGQTARSAVAAVEVSDGGPAPYRLTLTLERSGGRWAVSDLGDDD